MGGGLRAAFNYETRLNPDNITAAGMDRTRNMFLNLSGGFGAVTIGTYLNSFDTVRGFSAATYSAPGGDFLPNHIGIIEKIVPKAELMADGLTDAQATTLLALLNNGLSARSTNAIGYTSPSFSGLTASVGVSNEKTSTGNTSLNKIEGVIASLAYASGPLNARLALGEGKASLKTTATNLSSTKTTDAAFAVSYDLGVAVPYIQYENSKTTVGALLGEAIEANNGFKTSAAELGAKFPMGALTPYITVSAGNLKFDGDKIKTSAFQVGTTYDLSKRTSVYAAAGQFKLKEVSKTTGYKIGLIHNF